MLKILGLMTCFNRKEKTIRALKNLIEGNPTIDFSFIVVDDASTDGTAQAVEKIENVTLVSGNGNLFYSGGMRIAIAKAKQIVDQYDYCLLFNDDVEFVNSAIENLCGKDNSVIWIGPTCDELGKLTYGGVVKISRVRPKTEIVMAEQPSGKLCDTFNANCVLIPWEIFKHLDNIDEIYTHSMGDFDYGFSAKRKGYSIKVSDMFVGVCPDNPIKSQGNWRNTELSRKRRVQLKESPKGLPFGEYFHYLSKNYNLFTAVVYSMIPYVRIIIRR